MIQLVVISGKGGTGKTILTASFAALAQNKVMVDSDVDAANLYLLLHPEIKETTSFSGGKKAHLFPEKCTGCANCIEACRFDAISETDEGEIVIDPISCEGCGVCSFVCPEEAIEMKSCVSGEWFVSKTKYGPFVHAKLGIGEENSGKLVTEVRKKATKIAIEKSLDYIIIDGSPGIGCPVIASLTGTDLAIVITEPSLSGIHDMERVIQMADHFKIKTACCINKFDLNKKKSNQIEHWCQKKSIPLLGKIAYDEEVTDSMLQGIPLVEYTESSVSVEIKHIWESIALFMEKKSLKIEKAELDLREI